MENRDLRKLVKNLIEREEMLIELTSELLMELFKDDPYEYPKVHVDTLIDDLDSGIRWNGCIQGLSAYKRTHEERIKTKKDQNKKEE